MDGKLIILQNKNVRRRKNAIEKIVVHEVSTMNRGCRRDGWRSDRRVAGAEKSIGAAIALCFIIPIRMSWMER